MDMNRLRDHMVEHHVVRRGIRDENVTRAMRVVPREKFVDPGFEEFAYEDAPLSIGEGQTISQPFIVALMIEKADLNAGDKVLEVGTGSGYASALISRIVRHVYSIERHERLALQARDRFEKLGYGNIDVRVGDGSKGWAKAAPFDAIIVSAGAPEVPTALKEQLDLGGRLIIPVGRSDGQRLKRITRTGASTFEEEDLGGVLFVPLIGEDAWTAAHPMYTATAPSLRTEETSGKLISAAAEEFSSIDEQSFAALFDRFADSRIVLLGESTHGTAEFYETRAAISRHLIGHHGFNVIAVEADWPDAAAIDHWINGQAPGDGQPFDRFPKWMWRNLEFSRLVGWMKEENERRKASHKDPVRFYGLDLFNMSESIRSVLDYLETVSPDSAKIARERYGCLSPWQSNPATYGRAVLTEAYRSCEDAVLKQCTELLTRSLDDATSENDDFVNAVQSARLLAAAERYYRIMYYGGAQAWNLRDTYMADTVEHLLDYHGPAARIIIWAHNSHIGDARYTDMATARDELSLGQLCRQRFDGMTSLIGLGTHCGTVIAADDWDGQAEKKRMNPSLPESCERLCHDAAKPRFLLDLRADEELHASLVEQRLQRFIGVIYRPETERLSHYMSASLSRQYDAFVWFDETHALSPLIARQSGTGEEETFPFGF
ncbi:protein-L-isoaspartate(D-aspartate) O-methyltransferase [Rhizobium binae]|uniref:Protein-L-isoaspartate O-methyltransferase n=1 Tax=Rhizobium binae TaxID=1138190 RepID=A0ABV2MIC5_9HYPH|nr:protein-L-isoaspartate(D-aspartate) O-methyltransferase [Rhizobium binae]MBX4996205.1 protein-L-isoaspartate(D-aspartate) O-methyltransferase [Rhizobium binae]NKL48750.1 protein-L-isoaspartate(D-aspartate) O-methyltransferase [Rhizobium leguminosarum bv. viciae]QSY86652.1 protein-L-isoaspartate(D-aspartate) O-methyltransferase [Rhizobium binae]